MDSRTGHDVHGDVTAGLSCIVTPISSIRLKGNFQFLGPPSILIVAWASRKEKWASAHFGDGALHVESTSRGDDVNKRDPVLAAVQCSPKISTRPLTYIALRLPSSVEEVYIWKVFCLCEFSS